MSAAKGNGLDAANDQPAKTQTKNKSNSKPKAARFVGTDNPRYLRALAALLRSPQPRESIDREAGCSNGPALISELRDLGLTDVNLPCNRIKFIDRDGKVCRPGVYSLTSKGRRMIFAWLAKRNQGGTSCAT